MSVQGKIVRYGRYDIEKLHEWCVKKHFDYVLKFDAILDCFHITIHTGTYDVKVHEFYNGQAAIDYIEKATEDFPL